MNRDKRLEQAGVKTNMGNTHRYSVSCSKLLSFIDLIF